MSDRLPVVKHNVNFYYACRWHHIRTNRIIRDWWRGIFHSRYIYFSHRTSINCCPPLQFWVPGPPVNNRNRNLGWLNAVEMANCSPQQCMFTQLYVTDCNRYTPLCNYNSLGPLIRVWLCLWYMLMFMLLFRQGNLCEMGQDDLLWWSQPYLLRLGNSRILPLIKFSLSHDFYFPTVMKNV